jgi:hypothetical protein
MGNSSGRGTSEMLAASFKSWSAHAVATRVAPEVFLQIRVSSAPVTILAG